MACLVFLLVFWVLARACQRHGVGGFIVQFTIIDDDAFFRASLRRAKEPGAAARGEKTGPVGDLEIRHHRVDDRRIGGAAPKAPAVENFAWLPVGAVSAKSGRGSVSLI